MKNSDVGVGSAGVEEDDQGSVSGMRKGKGTKRKSSVLLWSGSREEVWRSVKVGRWAGKGGVVGRWLTMMVELMAR